MNRFGNIGGHVERNLIAHALGKIPAQFFHGFLDVLGHLHRVGSRKHIDTQHGSIASVDSTLRIIRGCLERNPGYIAQPDNRTVGIGTDNDFFELADIRQTSACGYRDGDIGTGHRLLSEHSGCSLAVLVLQSGLNILDGQSEMGQFVGLNPNLHGIITATDIRNAAYAGNTAQEVLHIKCGKIAQIDFIKTRVVGSQTDGHQLTRRLFFYGNTILNDFGRQTGFGQLQTVLHFNGSQICIGRNIKSHRGRKTS